MSISERFPETLPRLARVVSSKFRVDFSVILPRVFQNTRATTLVIFASTPFPVQTCPSLDTNNSEAPRFMREIWNKK